MMDAAAIASFGGEIKNLLIAAGAQDNAATTALSTGLAAKIAAFITTNAVVLPTGIPPMTTPSGAVVGTGKIT